ncbi:MAG: hypothetical protein GY797_25045 [Deltaproteobacteria bacterium]|nr:hypothetical protein [Deltaproteobacteria bacterium]
MGTIDQTPEKTMFFPTALHWLMVSVLFLLAFGVRVYYVNQPNFDFNVNRQYRSALIARAFYFEDNTSIPEWRREIAALNKQGILEPPIMELLVSNLYRLVGQEQLWVARLLSAIFWIIGGAFLYALATKIISHDAALFAVAFYLFLPFGITASLSFQPDSLMVMWLLFSLFMIVRYYEQPSMLRLVVAALISSIAMLVKPICLFLIFGTFISVAIYKQGFWKSLVNPKNFIFAIISVLPTAIFYIYGIFIDGFLRGQAQGSFIPALLLDSLYWRGWLFMIDGVIGSLALSAALLGLLMFRSGLSKTIMMGLWVGYVVFGLVFTFHIHTHDYYHLQLIPIVALSLGPIGALVLNRIGQVNQGLLWRVVVLEIFLLAMILSVYQIRLKFIDLDSKAIETAREIGELVDHSPSALYLDPYYGKTLQYYGEISGRWWPDSFQLRANSLSGKPIMQAEERFEVLSSNQSPEYFIVTHLRGLEQQQDLKQFLSQFPIVAQNRDYIIYDLKQSQGSER